SKDVVPEAASGRAVVHTFTVNWQAWYPKLDPPYVVAIVDLPEQDGLRLTTNLVGVEPDDVHIGMPVRVVFEAGDGVWLPFFEPDPDAPEKPTQASAPGVPARRRSSRFPATDVLERRAVISGVGQSQIGRRIYRDPLDLTIDAALAAIEDAGL